jgi:diadenosine tetraphosphate (Ap4A) HIT family hydrolase
VVAAARDTSIMDGCLACELADGRRPLPGGRIFRTHHWLVEHCVGPLGLGTLIVKPERHVTSVASLTDDEVAELGPLLRRASAVAARLVNAEQIYNCLWSHAGGAPVHIHYVVQPVTARQMAEFEAHGPSLQVAMFSRGEAPQESEIVRIAERARQSFVSE